MAIFTGGKSRAINSPRHLTLRHARRNVYKARKAKGLALLGEDDDGPDLLPGEERLNSFWAPSLVAGPQYTITAEQTVTAMNNDQPLLLLSQQTFSVDAPQFMLPEQSVYSVYPPSGYPEENRMLPHVVLSDPHLPWERIGSPSTEGNGDTRRRVPWLALFTFTQEELKLNPGDLKGLPNLPAGQEWQQTSTLSMKMTVGQMRGITNAANPIQDGEEEFRNINDKKGEFILIKSNLFKSLFSAFDENGNRIDKDKPDVSQYTYLSHVRKINTTGMAIGGTEDVGIFSIVVGARSGPMHNKTPVSVAVHLVSIEGVEQMTFPNPEEKQFVSLCSLHSWNYTVMPPNMLNVYDSFVNLGRSLSVLRPPQDVIDSLKGNRVSERLAKRLEDGFTLVKYRMQTGESTMALYRSPFTPTVVPKNPYFDTCSNSGQDFQILDQELGIVDVTYSSAWNLGRVLAVGDQGFTAALSRLRGAIHKLAMHKIKLAAAKKLGGETSVRTLAEVLDGMKHTVNKLDEMSEGLPTETPDPVDGPSDPATPTTSSWVRWFRPILGPKKTRALDLNNRIIEQQYLEAATEAALELSLAQGGDEKHQIVYDETNSPVSTDWMVVLAFVMDRMFLSGVPAHYLISDPSHLSPESLKFFYIDPNWVDAMIDGTLSLGNEKGTDMDRAAIKEAVNRFIKHLPEEQKHRPQVPTYGFYLRSDLVTMFPDLKVDTVRKDQEAPPQAPLLRHEIVADGVMLGLLDRTPGSVDFDTLIFTQPPHQPCFAVGNSLGADHLTVNMRKQYTVDKEERKLDPSNPQLPFKPPIEQSPTSKDNFFLWNTVPRAVQPDVEDDLRLLRSTRFAKVQLDMLNDKNLMKPYKHPKNPEGPDIVPFQDDTPNSALFAMQLTEPIYYLEIDLKKSGSGQPVPAIASLQPPENTTMIRSLAFAAPEGPLTLRTLHSTNHPIVPTLFPPTAASDDEDSGSEDDSDHPFLRPRAASTAASSIFSLDTSEPASLAYSPCDAPHIRSIPTVTSPILPPSPSTPHFAHLATRAAIAPEDPAGPPVFKCTAYTPNQNAIYTNSLNLPKDIVFSILVSNTQSNYMLKEFDVCIPLGDTKYQGRNMLMKTYQGAGATILSNLRFNALLQFSKLHDPELDVLMLRLLPRSSTGFVSVRKVYELSSILSLAYLNDYGKGDRVVRLITLAYFRGARERDPIRGEFEVVLSNDG